MADINELIKETDKEENMKYLLTGINRKTWGKFKDLCFKIEGLDNIENEDSDKYTVIVLMNRCMSWGLDYSVTDFLKKNNKHPHIIVLTTAANENWEPKWKKVAFDGITAASESSKVEQTALEIVKKIKAANKGS